MSVSRVLVGRALTEPPKSAPMLLSSTGVHRNVGPIYVVPGKRLVFTGVVLSKILGGQTEILRGKGGKE